MGYDRRHFRRTVMQAAEGFREWGSNQLDFGRDWGIIRWLAGNELFLWNEMNLIQFLFCLCIKEHSQMRRVTGLSFDFENFSSFM